MYLKAPQRTRPWYPKHGVQSDATHAGSGWVVERLRNFVYKRDGVGDEVWLSNVPVFPERVVRAWYLLEPFTDWSIVAHPYIIFEYDSGAVCFTIEGKRVIGDAFSGWKGLTNEYELGYIWISELDCLTMPLTHSAQALYLTPLELSAQEAGALCTEFLRDTHALFEKPEFYNTLTRNCTGLFAKTLRRVGRNAPWDLSWYFPGYSDSYLQRIGLINRGVELRSSRYDLVARADEVWSIIESSKLPFKKVAELISN